MDKRGKQGLHDEHDDDDDDIASGERKSPPQERFKTADRADMCRHP